MTPRPALVMRYVGGRYEAVRCTLIALVPVTEQGYDGPHTEVKAVVIENGEYREVSLSQLRDHITQADLA